MVSCDVYRPAAIDQLKTVAAQAGVEFFPSAAGQSPLVIAEAAATSQETNIQYSVDYGENFHTCAATTTPFNIYNVETRYSPSDRDRTDFNSQVCLWRSGENGTNYC